MQQKAFTLQNKGMNRDLSISKAGESSAYENHNIRIMARDNDTTLSVTNERGTKEVDLGTDFGIEGTLIGWNVLNEHLILFTHEDEHTDRIYRIDYVYDESSDEYVFKNMKANAESSSPLFIGNLDFDCEHPIESVVYHETDNIQKIYWIDGKNVLRFMNFMADAEEILYWTKDNEYTFFDSNRIVDFGVNVTIEKDNSGNTRANGTAQYLLTYYNKHGQESGYVWVSDLVYLSPVGVGGAADGTNNNRITLTFTQLDDSYTGFRVYSIIRTSINGTAQAYLVYEGDVNSSVTVVDDGSHLTAVDSSSLLFLGSQTIIPGTLAHKDQTLFLGDFCSTGKGENYDDLVTAIGYMRDGGDDTIYFAYTNDEDDIPYVIETDSYPYNNQLSYTSSEILSFKGGELYRFALVFKRSDGVSSEAFWIGDRENHLYPKIDGTEGKIHRIIAKCKLSSGVISAAKTLGFKTVQLMIAEATYSDRSVKAQGIISPTVFNTWNRYNSGLYSCSSWLLRSRNAEYAWKHFEPIHKSTTTSGEIECNYWTTEEEPTPYYMIKNYNTSSRKYVDSFDYGVGSDSFLSVVLGIMCNNKGYHIQLSTVRGTLTNTDYQSALLAHVFDSSIFPYGGDQTLIVEDHYEYTGYTIDIQRMSSTITVGWFDAAYAKLVQFMTAFNVPLWYLDKDQFLTWCRRAEGNRRARRYYNFLFPGSSYEYETETEAHNANGSSTARWYYPQSTTRSSSWDYTPAYYRKHLTFVDENIITLNSPELEQEAVLFDNVNNYKLRIVGAATITGKYSDYTVDATPGKLPGENLILGENNSSIISWPLWQDFGLTERQFEESDSDEEYVPTSKLEERTSYDYLWGSNIVRYWLHMWNHSGKINGYTDYDNNDYGLLRRKTFANFRYSYCTWYNNIGDNSCVYDNIFIRTFNYTSSQYVGIKVGNDVKYYDGGISDSLSLPGTHKYPILYSAGEVNLDEDITSDLSYLYSSSPVQIEYLSSPHAIISLGTDDNDSAFTYKQELLPYMFQSERFTVAVRDENNTGYILPWIGNTVDESDYPNKYYSVNQKEFRITGNPVSEGQEYVLIGEIYYDFEASGSDTRYGGTSDTAIQNNRFIPAGPVFLLSDMGTGHDNIIIANQGDTYFQRWDCLKTKPYSTGSVNNVIDVTSVMLETHINIDGRSDLLRSTKYLASIDPEKFNTLNWAYSQQNNFYVSRDLDEDFDQDAYRSTITWTLPKTDSGATDEWSHITLASTLKLDGDKGICRALRRFQNSIISFQDKAISEILFNSRTQLSTTDGVPVEIANSGKVDGKRYITNKFGCINKWSITEGKSALYFVDNINKAFCAFSGNGVDTLSTRLGFDVWFRNGNTLKLWTPEDFENIVSYYDRVHSDIYLVKGTEDEMSCLVYNEKLGAFTSFFDYGHVPMMTNVEDRFVSFKNNSLWFQNEGLYCNFFGEQKDFWVQYRVTPDPFGDKIWSGFDYRADFYNVLDSTGNSIVPEEYLINGDSYGNINDLYLENDTFDTFSVWNEYQSTGDVDMFADTSMDDPVQKKFRIWRRTIPRAQKLGTNRYGLDRIRNPWINLKLHKSQDDDENQNLMQLHDIVVRYFE